MKNNGKPYLAIDVLTNENLGRYEDYNDAYLATKDRECVDIQYRPTKRNRSK